MSHRMRVAFRVDSSIHIGSGHLIRCLTLANELRKYTSEIIFICRDLPGNLIKRLEDAHYTVYLLRSLPEVQVNSSDDYAAWLGVTQEQDAVETLTVLNEKNFDWIIVDHYGLDVAWEKAVKSVIGKIMVIDDLANRQHDCSILLDQNYLTKHSNNPQLSPQVLHNLLLTNKATMSQML